MKGVRQCDLYRNENVLVKILNQKGKYIFCENKMIDGFLLRLSYYNSFYDGVVDKKNRVKSILLLALGWFIGFLFYSLIKVRIPIRRSGLKSTGNKIVFFHNTPNQIKLKNQLIADDAIDFEVVGTSILSLYKSKNCELTFGFIGFRSVLKSFRRLIVLIRVVWRGKDLELGDYRSCIKFGYNISLATDFFTEVLMEFIHSMKIDEVSFTYTGYWLELFISRLNEFGYKTTLYCHGAVGNALLYRTLAKTTVVKEELDLNVIKKYSFSKNYECVRRPFFGGMIPRNNQVLYCTNLGAYQKSHVNFSEVRNSLYRCNNVIESLVDDGYDVCLRLHPRETVECYESLISKGVCVYDFKKKMTPSIVICHESSVLFDYIGNARVYIYRDKVDESMSEFSSLRVFSEYMGFENREELDGLIELSDKEYFDLVANIVQGR